jgi:ABC-type nitrate/sulfonate/bicarbonate transport system permease component
MAGQVVARRGMGQGVGVLALTLLGGLLVGVVLQFALTLVLGDAGGPLARNNLVVAIVWPLWALIAVEAVYARMPLQQRILPLGTARALAGWIVLIFLWEVGARLLNNRLALVPLSEVWAALVKLAGTGELAKSMQVSLLEEFVPGFALAIVVGVVLGLLLATNTTVRDYVEPWVSFLYAVPLVAITPLFIVVFGIGPTSKQIVIFLVAVFIIVVNTEVGVLSTDPNLIEAARSFGASRLQIFRKVLLPAALPFIVAGLRLGLARGLVGVVVAEFFGSRAGLGFLIQTSSQTFDTASLFVGVLVLAVGGYLGVELLKLTEHKLAPWRHFELRD